MIFKKQRKEIRMQKFYYEELNEFKDALNKPHRKNIAKEYKKLIKRIKSDMAHLKDINID